MPSTIGRLSPTAIGIIFVLLGATALAIQNVVARLIFSPSQLFGQVPVGGFLDAAMGSILVLLLLRMAGMAMVLAAISPRLYPATFSDLRQLPHLRRLFWQAIASGVCLFLALALTYLALSQAAAGIAIAIVFIYPAITMLMAWKVFGQRPPLHQRWLLLVILFGVLLTSLDPQDMTLSNSALGIFAALGASLAFGGYNILSEVCLQPSQRYPARPALHPIPFSLITFITVVCFSTALLLFTGPVDISAAAWPMVILISVLSVFLTLGAYLLNNYGLRLIGATLTALVSSGTPILTALFAWLALQEMLQLPQMAGVVLTALGIAALSLKSR